MNSCAIAYCVKLHMESGVTDTQSSRFTQLMQSDHLVHSHNPRCARWPGRPARTTHHHQGRPAVHAHVPPRWRCDTCCRPGLAASSRLRTKISTRAAHTHAEGTACHVQMPFPWLANMHQLARAPARDQPWICSSRWLQRSCSCAKDFAPSG